MASFVSARGMLDSHLLDQFDHEIVPIINPMLTLTAMIARVRRPFCCRIDVRFSQQWPECLTSPR
jgi:hypothetical protein